MSRMNSTQSLLTPFSLAAFTIILAGVLLASIWFLWPAPLEFPMDDTYIHFVYAKNLAESGKLMFNSPDEAGLGITSITWVLLLAGGLKLGIPMFVTAKVAGIISLVFVGMGVLWLLRCCWHPLPSLLRSLLFVLSGNMLWFALSGMETVLFLSLGLFALLCHQKEKWGWLGVTLGLLILTRPEGVLLAVLIGIVEIWRRKELHRGILLTVLIATVICGPWFGYLFWRTGYILPTSAIGKRLSTSVGISLVLDRNESLAAYGKIPNLIYPVVWLVYILEFVLGGMSLPPPRIPVGALLGLGDYTYSVWALFVLAIVITPLTWACVGRVGNPRKLAIWVMDHKRRPMIILATWVVLHNILYMIVLPSPGTASRYGALNHVALWIALTIGLFCFIKSCGTYWFLAGGLFVIAGINTVFWNGVYDANLEHMRKARIEAAHYVRDSLLPSERCAAFDIGAIRFFSQRPIVDLGGLLDPTLGQKYLEGDLDRYLVDNKVTCLIMPGRTDSKEEGWFDFAEIMGLTTTPLFEMQPVAVFEIDRERWLQGYLPTNNYQATVAIYQLVKRTLRHSRVGTFWQSRSLYWQFRFE